jgi:hypothetical protein
MATRSIFIKTVSLILLTNFNILGQTYFGYQPRGNNSNVDYSKVGKDFSDAIQKKTQEREELKKYYDEMYYKAKSNLTSMTQLTANSAINSKILLMQSSALNRLDWLNYSLKNGTLSENNYTSRVNDLLHEFSNANLVFVNINQYYNNKITQKNNDFEKTEFERYFSESINSIEEIIFEPYEVKINLRGLIYPNCNASNLYNFISTSCEGYYSTYKKNWEDHQETIKRNIAKQNEEREKFYQEWDKARSDLFSMRSKYISNLSPENVDKFKKSERRFLIITLKNLKKNYKIPQDTNILKEVNYWLRFENSKHEFFLLDKNANKEPLLYEIPRHIVGILHYLYKNNNK